MINPPPVKPTPEPGTVAADPTLGLLSHVLAVAVGSFAGYLSTHFSVDLSADTQGEIALAIGSLATTAVHYLQARVHAVKVTS